MSESEPKKDGEFDIVVDDGEFFLEQDEERDPLINQILFSNSVKINALLYLEKDFVKDLQKFNQKFRDFGEKSFVNAEFLVLALDVYLFNLFKGNTLLSDLEAKIFEKLFQFSESFLRNLWYGQVDLVNHTYKNAKRLKDLYLRLLYLRNSCNLTKSFSKNKPQLMAFGFIDSHLDHLLSKIVFNSTP